MDNPNQPREQERIQCRECGRWFRALPTHLIRKHGLSDEDYRLKYAISVGVPLVCLEWSERQSQVNHDLDLKRTLSSTKQAPGYTQRESVRQNRRDHYAGLAKAGTSAAAQIDKTAARRELLRPYPVTVEQASERLACTKSAAYTFLSYCLTSGKLSRIGRGLYGEVKA
jgi:hypothetical protein